MAWEKRGDNFYYYQSEREGNRVKKKYIGRASSELPQIIAHADERIGLERQAARERERASLERMGELARLGDELYEAAQTLAVCEMVAGGYHRHKGEWRMRRDA